MPQVLWLVGLPLGVAMLVYLLRRLWAGAVLAALVTLLLSWLTVRLPTGVVFNLLGRPIELTLLGAGEGREELEQAIVDAGLQQAAEAAKGKGIETVVFDRGGFAFGSNLKTLADSAREAGLKF